jgi:hypothetical protein
MTSHKTQMQRISEVLECEGQIGRNQGLSMSPATFIPACKLIWICRPIHSMQSRPGPAQGAQILTDVLLDRAKSSATFFNGQPFP